MKSGVKKYQGFLIDADNTIFDYSRSEKEAFIETMQTINYMGSMENAHQKYQAINHSLWQDFESNKIASGVINKERFTLLVKTLGIKTDIEKLAACYLETLSRKTYTLPHTVKTLEVLSRKATLCLISNGLSYVQRNRIARSGIEIFFSSIIISEEIGCSKPNSEFFKTALELINLPAYSVLCIGDSPSADIRGGHFYGLDTCWFMYRQTDYPDTEPLPDYIINDFNELEKFVPYVS